MPANEKRPGGDWEAGSWDADLLIYNFALKLTLRRSHVS